MSSKSNKPNERTSFASSSSFSVLSHTKYEALNDKDALPLPISYINEIKRDTVSYHLLRKISLYLLALSILVCSLLLYVNSINSNINPMEGQAWGSIAVPYSVVDPRDLGFLVADRTMESRPGPIFEDLMDTPLPTNSWCENLFLGASNNGANNKVFQVPYIVDTGGKIPGIRTHTGHVQANDRSVMMNYEDQNGVSIGAVETFSPQHKIASGKHLALARLAVALQWSDENDKGYGPSMLTQIVRGSPYSSMEYMNATPRLYVQRSLTIGFNPVIDNDPNSPPLLCGDKEGVFGEPRLVNSEIRVQIDAADTTWLIFVSEPTLFVCSNVIDDQQHDSIPGAPVDVGISHFDLRAVNPMKRGMIRIALSNNCTTGQNAEFCDKHLPMPIRARNQDSYAALLRKHADIYPTGNADVRFTFPVESEEEEELHLTFDWAPASMSLLRSISETDPPTFEDSLLSAARLSPDTVELLMFGIPHHQERLRGTAESSNKVQSVGCTPTLHGIACPVTGNRWSLFEHLHRVSFSAPRSPRPEMLDDIRDALDTDIDYELPINYMKGAGDTYFAGKMLARLGRILIIADEVKSSSQEKFNGALSRLQNGVEVWFNGAAESLFLYDRSWGGMVMCGCNFNGDTNSCNNAYPDCPALTDMGQNFGAGFYNDHHYHFGYIIYAAAVVCKFNHAWCKKYHEHVSLLIRDIANPSKDDPFFPTFRHKDWYLGFSWASGIVTIQGNPYPNGRNQESSSEAISAYEAVALYGDVSAKAFSGVDSEKYGSALRMRDMGRLLLATEVRSARTYWHVQDRQFPAPNSKNSLTTVPIVSRIYPDEYKSKVVGMLWSMLAQEQTWFGLEAWKSYGIQLMPLTVASEQRDDPAWIVEMLPDFQQSCEKDVACEKQGWSILVYSCMAVIGQWEEAWNGVNSLESTVYQEAGGNGHSKVNTLWYIATRPDVQR